MLKIMKMSPTYNCCGSVVPPKIIFQLCTIRSRLHRHFSAMWGTRYEKAESYLESWRHLGRWGLVVVFYRLFGETPTLLVICSLTDWDGGKL